MILPGIYIHLPFCKVHCSYCDFPLTTKLSYGEDYYRCLLQEIATLPAPEADTLYFGGGTPSLTPVSMLKQIRNHFTLAEEAEITLEANPDDITPERLTEWREAGITRLSIGIQSLEPEVLRGVLRQHTRENALDALHLARRAGFENFNADLILGLPHQTKAGFLQGLMELMEIRPQHFSIYFLEVHENTALARQLHSGEAKEMPEEDQLESYERAVELLKQAGYQHYEVSNFALPGSESKHNLKYWTSAPYYGYGAGACSYHDALRVQNVVSVAEYIGAVRSGKPAAFTSTTEDLDTQMRNTVIFGLRRRDGVEIVDFERSYGISPLALFPDGQDLISEGFLEVTDTRLRLTHRGMLLSNDILSRLV